MRYIILAVILGESASDFLPLFSIVSFFLLLAGLILLPKTNLNPPSKIVLSLSLLAFVSAWLCVPWMSANTHESPLHGIDRYETTSHGVRYVVYRKKHIPLGYGFLWSPPELDNDYEGVAAISSGVIDTKQRNRQLVQVLIGTVVGVFLAQIIGKQTVREDR